MGAVFDRYEPFAKELWRHDIADFAGEAGRFAWRKETFFGGLYQKVVAHRTNANTVKWYTADPADGGSSQAEREAGLTP